MALNALTGISEGFRTPGNFAEILFAQGPASAAAGAREVVFVMPMTSVGTWTSGTLYSIANADDAKEGGGVGSPIARGITKFLTINKDAKVWALPVAETTGGTPVAATSVLTIATTPTGVGTVSVTIAGVLCEFTFTTTDTVTTIGDGITAAINAKVDLPCTAANAVGVVTVTAKLKGTSQGTATLGVIRTRVEITTGIATTAVFGGAFLGTGVTGAEGTTTEAANITTALTTIDNVRKYYIVSSSNDSASLALFDTHVVTKSEPKRGLRSRVIAAYTGSLATGQTIAIARNYERMQIAWQPNSEHDCAELAGTFAAFLQKKEQLSLSYNFNGESLTGHILPAFSAGDWPDRDDQEDAIIDGLTTFSSNDAGTNIVHSITTRSKDSAGTLNDSRASRSVKVSVADGFTDTLLVRYGLRYGQKRFKDDERLADGSINTNQKQIPGVVRPSMIITTIVEVVDEFADEHLQEIAVIKESISVAKSTTNPGRAVSGMNLWVIDWLDQITTRVAEISIG